MLYILQYCITNCNTFHIFLITKCSPHAQTTTSATKSQATFPNQGDFATHGQYTLAKSMLQLSLRNPIFIVLVPPHPSSLLSSILPIVPLGGEIAEPYNHVFRVFPHVFITSIIASHREHVLSGVCFRHHTVPLCSVIGFGPAFKLSCKSVLSLL